MWRAIETISRTIRAALGDPNDIHFRGLPTLSTRAGGRLVTGVPIRAEPVEYMKILHDRNHGYIFRDIRQQHLIESLSECTVSIGLHHPLSCRDPSGFVRGCPLADRFGMIDQCDPWVIRDTWLRPLPIKNCDDLGIRFR